MARPGTGSYNAASRRCRPRSTWNGSAMTSILSCSCSCAHGPTTPGSPLPRRLLSTASVSSRVGCTPVRSMPKWPELATEPYRCPRGWLDDDTIQSLAGHTMAEALNYFKFQVLMKNKWDATREASLATFFVGQCKFQFANIYKTWHTDQAADRKVALYNDPPTALPADGMPGDEFMTEAAARVVLDQLSTPLARQVFWRKFVLDQLSTPLARQVFWRKF